MYLVKREGKDIYNVKKKIIIISNKCFWTFYSTKNLKKSFHKNIKQHNC